MYQVDVLTGFLSNTRQRSTPSIKKIFRIEF